MSGQNPACGASFQLNGTMNMKTVSTTDIIGCCIETINSGMFVKLVVCLLLGLCCNNYIGDCIKQETQQHR